MLNDSTYAFEISKRRLDIAHLKTGINGILNGDENTLTVTARAGAPISNQWPGCGRLQRRPAGRTAPILVVSAKEGGSAIFPSITW